jgi:hypothetical protein
MKRNKKNVVGRCGSMDLSKWVEFLRPRYGWSWPRSHLEDSTVLVGFHYVLFTGKGVVLPRKGPLCLISAKPVTKSLMPDAVHGSP